MKEENKVFYHSLATLVIPITIQNFITNAVNSADVFMLGCVGQTELSAVSLANQFQFLLTGFLYGISSGITILASQYWGRKDTNSIQAVMGIALKIALAATLCIAAGAIAAPKMLMRIYTDNGELIAIGASYLRVVGVSYVLMGFSQVYLCTLRSMERARLSMMISSAALLLNVALNAVFIFGIAGAPKLGVTGVALATAISRAAELLLCCLDAARGRQFQIRPDIIFGRNRLLFLDFLRYSIPALVNDGAWTVAFSMYSSIMGHLNADVVAASSVADTVRSLCTILSFALAVGASVLLGIEIGEGRLEDARRDSAKSCHITLFVGVLTGIVILLIRPFVFTFFVLSERAAGYLSIMLAISAYYVIGQAMNTLLIAGIFRAGGDSRFGMVCDIIVMWGISVPLGLISAFVLKLPPMAVYFILCLDEFWKIPVVYRHYKSFRWLKNITRDFS